MSKEPNPQIFTLRYYKQTQHQVNFYATDLEDGIQQGKEYCETFRLRFLRVDPLAVDLKAIIANKEKNV